MTLLPEQSLLAKVHLHIIFVSGQTNKTMNNFDWTSFSKRIAVNAPLPDIYNAWTRASDIEKWFLSRALFFDANKKPIPSASNTESGNTYEWRWHAQDFEEHGKITAANGKDLLQFTFAGDCIVEVRLTEKNGSVWVELTQKNIPTDNASRQGIRLGCDAGWSFYLVNLKSVYEGGLDLRNKDPEFKAGVNN
jgi:uncharacterized protein YndB with AHSA1/START domain